MDAPERYEQLMAFLDSNLPVPVDRQDAADGSAQFIAGEPAEVVVTLTDTSVIVCEFSGVWESPFTFTAVTTSSCHGRTGPAAMIVKSTDAGASWNSWTNIVDDRDDEYAGAALLANGLAIGPDRDIYVSLEGSGMIHSRAC